MDPNFSVLLEDKPKNCGVKKSKDDSKIIAIVVPIVVVAVLAVVV